MIRDERDPSKPSMPSTLLGVDPRTVEWKYGFSVNHFAALSEGMFVMLAQPNLGVQRHAELFVVKLEQSTQELMAVGPGAVQPGLDDGNLQWAVF